MTKIAVIELPATWGAPQRALALVDEVLGAGPAADIVLLPEASLTGYVSPNLDFDLTRFAEPIDGPTAAKLSELAQRHHTHLFGPLILEERGEYFNATVGFGTDGGHIVTYRKRHPWIPEQWATAGRAPFPLFEVAGLKTTIACCYDVHFLADEAVEQLNSADLLLFPSAWVEEEDSRPRRLRAIARRHGVAIAAANWGPGQLKVSGQGASTILDTSGNVVASATSSHIRADADL